MSETDFQFPSFSLEDKAAVKWGGTVEGLAKGPPLQVYVRRARAKEGSN